MTLIKTSVSLYKQEIRLVNIFHVKNNESFEKKKNNELFERIVHFFYSAFNNCYD